jgi:hypothetical protein
MGNETPSQLESLQNDQNVEYLGKFENIIEITPNSCSLTYIGWYRTCKKNKNTKMTKIPCKCIFKRSVFVSVAMSINMKLNMNRNKFFYIMVMNMDMDFFGHGHGFGHGH